MTALYLGLALAWLFSFLANSSVAAESLTYTTTTIRSTTTIRTVTVTIPSSDSPTHTTKKILPPTTTHQNPGATPTMAMGSAGYSGDAFKSAVLNSTNVYREHHQAKALTWDSKLAAYSQRYAEKCIWEHSGGPYGENLALGFPNPTLAVDAWGNEEAKYDYGDGGFHETTGHFTQLVWEGTTKVGCGAVNCNSATAKGWYLVCEYDPPGNVIGQFKQNVEKPGMGKDGQLGLGAASMSRVSKMFLALVVVSSVAVVWL